MLRVEIGLVTCPLIKTILPSVLLVLPPPPMVEKKIQPLRLFSESAESIGVLKVDLAEAKKRLGACNKQLHHLSYRSVTLRHIISLLDQIENIAKVPARIEKLIAEKQFYVAVQVHVQSALMLEREGLQTVA